MADFGADIELEGFRAEAKAWLDANFPKSLSGKGAVAMSERQGQSPDLATWRKAIGEKGWATPTWPAQYGGGGLSPQERLEVMMNAPANARGAPFQFGTGKQTIQTQGMKDLWGTKENAINGRSAAAISRSAARFPARSSAATGSATPSKRSSTANSTRFRPMAG